MLLFLRLWKNASHASATRRATAKPRPLPRSRPHLEPLEDRLAPATLTWTGQGGNDLWSNPNNWAERTTPYLTPEADDLIFPRSGAPRASNHDGLATAIHNIRFDDSGYSIRGGDLTVAAPAVFLNDAPGGDNFIENRSLFISPVEHGFLNMRSSANNNLIVRSNISGGGPLTPLLTSGHIGDGSVTLRGRATALHPL